MHFLDFLDQAIGEGAIGERAPLPQMAHQIALTSRGPSVAYIFAFVRKDFLYFR